MNYVGEQQKKKKQQDLFKTELQNKMKERIAPGGPAPTGPMPTEEEKAPVLQPIPMGMNETQFGMPSLITDRRRQENLTRDEQIRYLQDKKEWDYFRERRDTGIEYPYKRDMWHQLDDKVQMSLYLQDLHSIDEKYQKYGKSSSKSFNRFRDSLNGFMGEHEKGASFEDEVEKMKQACNDYLAKHTKKFYWFFGETRARKKQALQMLDTLNKISSLMTKKNFAGAARTEVDAQIAEREAEARRIYEAEQRRLAEEAEQRRLTEEAKKKTEKKNPKIKKVKKKKAVKKPVPPPEPVPQEIAPEEEQIGVSAEPLTLEETVADLVRNRQGGVGDLPEVQERKKNAKKGQMTPEELAAKRQAERQEFYKRFWPEVKKNYKSVSSMTKNMSEQEKFRLTALIKANEYAAKCREINMQIRTMLTGFGPNDDPDVLKGQVDELRKKKSHYVSYLTGMNKRFGEMDEVYQKTVTDLQEEQKAFTEELSSRQLIVDHSKISKEKMPEMEREAEEFRETERKLAFAKKSKNLPILDRIREWSADFNNRMMPHLKKKEYAYITGRQKVEMKGLMKEIRQAGLKIGDLTKEEYEELKNNDLTVFLGQILMVDEYNSKIGMKKPTFYQTNGKDITFENGQGKLTETSKKSVATMVFNGQEEGQLKLQVYPNPMTYDYRVKKQGVNNSRQGFGTCGIAVGSQVINQLYGREITNENINLENNISMKNCEMSYLPKRNRNGEVVRDPVTKQAQNSQEIDAESLGGTTEMNMTQMFGSYGIATRELNDKLSPDQTINEIARAVKKGEGVMLCVNHGFLAYGEEDKKAQKGGDFVTDHWVAVSSACYEKVGNKEILKGFLVKDTGAESKSDKSMGRLTYVPVERLKFATHGNENCRITNPKCVIAEKPMLKT